MAPRSRTLACIAVLSTTSACFNPDPPALDEDGSTGMETDATASSSSSGIVDDEGTGDPDSTSGDVPMPCAAVTCDANATCSDATGDAVCTCNEGWEGDGTTCENVDECADGSSDCDPNSVCMDLPGSYACSCNRGFVGEGTTCADIDECADDTDGCNASELCLNEPGGVACACIPGTSGAPCSPGTVLVYVDTEGEQHAELAATSLGYTVTSTADRAAFQAAFDAGGYDLVIYDAPGSGLDPSDETRLTGWVSGGGRLVFSAYNLESFPTLQAAFGVSTVTYELPRPIHLPSNAMLSLYAQRETITSPMTSTQDAGDNGDELTLTGDGLVLARLDDPAGPGVIVLTHEHRVVVNGFLPYDIGTADGDGDGTQDMIEMYRNQIDLLMHPRVLSHHEPGQDGPQAAARRIGWTSIPTSSGPAFNAAYDAGLYDIVVIDLPTTSLPTGVRTRLVKGLAGSDRLVFGWWDLESDAPLQGALGVDVVSIGMPQEVYDDPSGASDFFHVFQEVPDPLTPTEDAPGNGQSCAPTGAGSIEAHFESATGAGAICVTNDGRVIVNGFLPYDIGDADADGDMIRDVEELYENQYYRLMAL